jgi:hypothetical protein
VLAVLCETLMTLSGAYLVVALFIKSHTRLTAIFSSGILLHRSIRVFGRYEYVHVLNLRR